MSLEKRLTTCKWCYRVYLKEDYLVHQICRQKSLANALRMKADIEYDKTRGQKNDRTSRKFR
jgi:hypothetical protein